MNISRRKFINVGTLSLGISALPICNFLKKKTELEDLYDYVESNLHPINGNIPPFKLYPHHKRILKNIHENDRVVIVKARQIGMTTLLAVYLKWLNGPYKYITANQEMGQYFRKILNKFDEKLNCESDNTVYVLDEVNLNRLPFPHPKNKTIIVGTPDARGNLKYVVDRKDLFKLKVFTYSVHDCYPMWDKNKINFAKNVYNKNMNDNYLKRDLDAKFV